MKVVIIGGVAGGASAAARLRRLSETLEIIIFERGEYISYANCGLPYYVGGVIAEREKLFLQTPAGFGKRFNIQVRTRHNVQRIDRHNKQLQVENLETGKVFNESYDKLILSPGAEPLKPPIPGIDLEGIFTLRNVPDTDRIVSYVEAKKPKRAVIVGAGFIGLEMAENLHKRGIFVTIVEMADQVMTPLDYEMAAAVHQHLKTKKVEFYLKDAVQSFVQKGKKLGVALQSGRELESDLVILSIGVKPESNLARDCGLEIGPAGGIKVDEHLMTRDPNIYAVGDAIEFRNPIIGVQMIAYLAGPSTKQARMAADNILNHNRFSYSGTIATAIAKVFDLTVASTGASEKLLRQHDIPYRSSIIHTASHAGYYPNAQPLTIKIQFAPDDGKLYGAQIVGYTGVDKRIDLIATVIKCGGTVYNLTEIEHAYAPPFSSSKDPVNIAGFVAENILEGMVEAVHWYDVTNSDPKTDLLLDVRNDDEVENGFIPNSQHIPLDELRDSLDELPRDKRIIVYCAVGLRGYLACRILMQNGFDRVVNLSGGYKTYEHTACEQSNEDIYEHLYIAKDDLIYSSEPHESDSDK
ncbi:FAD-dependent oxidoreductase [candidate division KSB1 bacterium]|nr:FAD-dependent oxidoreductase [candidate division KSB1 bacterium]